LPGIAAKLQSKLVKHGVSFEEAQTVFPDEDARLIDDPDHSEEEEGSCYWGIVFRRCLIVSHCYREPDSTIPVDFGKARDSAGRRSVLETPMKSEYDFSKPRKNPYAKQLKRQITIRLDVTAVNYFKEMAAELGMPYQNLINLFLRDCAMQKRRPAIQWPEEAPKRRVGR
jgi:uncharacterized DUF497 family protein